MLAEHSDALEDLFKIDEELVTWRTWEELRDKVTYYRDRPDERRALADAGRRAVLERHTIEQRVATMLEMLAPPGVRTVCRATTHDADGRDAASALGPTTRRAN